MRRLAAFLALALPAGIVSGLAPSLGPLLAAELPSVPPRPVESLYRLAYTVETEGVEMALGGGEAQTLWLLRPEPPALLRLGSGGEVREEIPFEPPRHLRLGSSYRPLAVVPGGFAVAEYLYDLGGGAGHLAGLAFDGLRVFDSLGTVVLRLPPTAFSPTASEEPRRVALGTGPDGAARIAVAGPRRFWLLGMGGGANGDVLGEGSLPAGGGSPWIRDLGLDGAGRLHLLAVNPPVLHVLGPALGLEATLPLGGERLAVHRSGSFHLLEGGRLSYFEPLEGVGDAVGEAGVGSGQKRLEARDDVLDLGEQRGDLRLHTASKPVWQAAPDPRLEGVLWLATGGGVVRVELAPEPGSRPDGEPALRKWTFLDGLPDGDVRGIAFDTAGRAVAFTRRGAARLEGERFVALPPPRADAVRVVEDPYRPERAWVLAGNRLLRFDRGPARVSRVAEVFGLRDAVPRPDGTLVLLDHEGLRRLTPFGAVEDLWRFASLDAEAVEALALGDGVRPERIARVEDGWWIGTSDGDVFVLGDDGRLVRPPWSEAAARTCAGPWPLDVLPGVTPAAGGRRLLVSRRCLGVLEGDAFRPLRADLAVRSAVVDPRDPGRLWLGTDRGLAALTGGEPGRGVTVRWVRPTEKPDGPGEPDGTRVEALLAVAGRLWVAVGEGALCVFDPTAERWRTFPQVRAVGLAEDGGTLWVRATTTHCRGATALYAVDPERLSVLRRDCRLGRLFQWSADGFAAAGETLWGLGEGRRDGEPSLGRIDASGVPRLWPSGGEPESGDSPLLAGPDGFVYFVAGEELRRLDAASGKRDALREGVSAVHRFDGRFLGLEGREPGLLDLETLAFHPVDVRSRLVPDGALAGTAWGLRGRELRLVEVPSGRVLRRLALPEGSRWTHLEVLGGRIFVGGGDGLLEVPRRLAGLGD